MRGSANRISAVSAPISSAVVMVTAVSQLPSAFTVLAGKSTTPKAGSNRKLVNIPVETMTHSVPCCARSISRTSSCSSNRSCGLPRPMTS
ncbi:hypothetical protein D3C71_1529850 [compost metagenome]